jgi:hypothetical protein
LNVFCGALRRNTERFWLKKYLHPFSQFRLDHNKPLETLIQKKPISRFDSMNIDPQRRKKLFVDVQASDVVCFLTTVTLVNTVQTLNEYGTVRISVSGNLRALSMTFVARDL